jgi:hypothetical protein
MNIENLTESVEIFKNELLKISNKRQQWTNLTKPLLRDTLKNIKLKFDLDWNTYVMDNITNSEGVNITFGNSSSGIYERTETGHKSYSKRGGTLTFSQAYNGDIFIIILYPSVDELVIPVENQKLVSIVLPEIITEEFIYEQVQNFLNEMTLWESSSSHKPIGFNVKR